MTDLTADELKAAYDFPINAMALGYYVMDGASLHAEPVAFTKYIQDVNAVVPNLPIIDWETSAPTNNMTEEQQAEWANKMMATSIKEDLVGFKWWQYIDWAPVPTHPCTPQDVKACQGQHFGAHRLNGTAKKVWSAVAQGVRRGSGNRVRFSTDEVQQEQATDMVPATASDPPRP